MMCRGHSHIHMYYKKKRSICFFLFVRPSLPPSLSLPFSIFWHFYPRIFCSFSCLRRSSILEPHCFFFVFHCLVLVVMRKERERRRKLYNSAKCLCVCALIDYIFCLSKSDAENACFAFSFLMLRNFFFRSTS